MKITSTIFHPAIFIFALTVAGCSFDEDTAAVAPAPSPLHSPRIATPYHATPLRLDAGDQLRVIVFGEERVSGAFTIGNDGTLTLPLAGAVEVAGLTPREAGKRIASHLNGMLINPQVSVSVTSWRPIYITGEVERAGQYAWQPGLNLVSALALAGGPTRRASRSELQIQRQGKGTLVTMPLSPETLVYPGDLIKATERFF